MTTKEQILKVCEYASGVHSTKVLCAMVNALPREEILETNRSVDGIFVVQKFGAQWLMQCRVNRYLKLAMMCRA